MKRVKTALIAFLLIFIVSAPALSKMCLKTIAEEVLIARATLKPLSSFSARFLEFNVSKAYEVQKLVVNRLKKIHEAKVCGFKAAFTTKASQKKFAMKEPAYGVLLDYMIVRDTICCVHTSGKTIKPMIEVEIGFVIGKDISKPIKNVAQLKKYIKSAFFAIEVPDIRFHLKGLKGADVIADDVGTFLVIKGKEFNPFKVDLENIKAKLYVNGKLKRIGYSKYVLGNPLNSLLWLVNKVISQGEKIKKGYIVITGTMTKMYPAMPGNYTAVYGKLGTLKFRILP